VFARTLTVASIAAAYMLALPRPLAAQFSASVNITPGGGSYPVNRQVVIHVDFCATEGFFDGGGVVYQNDVPVAGSVHSSMSGCSDYAYADFTATLSEAVNTFHAVICGSTGCGEGQVDLTTPPDPPAIDLTPHNGYNRNVGLCVATCFNTATSYTTPAYWALDAPRAVSLYYSSGQVESRHTVEFVATNQAAVEPNLITGRLRRPDGSYVTLVTGGTLASFTPPGPGAHRYALQFEDSTLATGAYDYSLVVAGDWGNGVSETSVPIRVLVINERASPYGAGWSVAGVQRIILGPVDSLATWDGAGTVQFWTRTSCVGTTCTYAAPLGEFDQLQRFGTAPNFSYVRTMVDGTKLTFGVFGQLLSVTDVFNNQMQIKWKPSDTQRIDTIIDPVGKKIAFTYDGSNRLATIRDLPGNRTTSFTVNAQNNLTQIQDAVGGQPFQQATYDSYHRLLARLDRRGGRWASTYDVAGKLATDSTPAVTADGVSQRLVTIYRSFDAKALSAPDSGGIGTVTPPVGSQRRVRVDAFGALLEVLAPASEFAQYSRNEHGQITSALSNTGNLAYTWSGPRLTSRVNVTTGATVTYEWNTTANRVTRQYGGGAPDIRYYYDAAGAHLDSVRVGTDTPAVRYTYDPRGRTLTVRDQRGHLDEYFYSSTALFTIDSARTGTRRSAYSYDGLGRVIAVRNPANRVDSLQYDILNRLRRTASPLGHAITYGYGDSLNLTTLTDALGQVFGLEKNAVGWDSARVDPTGKRDFYARDQAGRVTAWTNRRGQQTSFAYDSAGRLKTQTLSDGRITSRAFAPTWAADSSAEGSDTVRWVADTIYQIAVRGGVAHRVRDFYDATTRRSTIDVWRDGQAALQVRYDMDTLGRVWRITVPDTSKRDTLRYSSDGMLRTVGLHGITTVSSLYRPGHDLASVMPSVNPTEFGRSYGQDSVGKAAEMVLGSSLAFEKYTYDSLDRLTGVERWSAAPQCTTGDTLSEFGVRCYPNRNTLLGQSAFTYDVVGNRTDSAIVTTGNRVARFHGDSLLYDFDGNITRRFRIQDSSVFNQRLYWNSAGQLDSARTIRQTVLQTAKFGYDYAGRRVRKTVGSTITYYVYDGTHVVAEYTGTGILQRHYSYYPGTDHPHSVAIGGTRYYFMGDAIGSVTGLIGPSGGGTAIFARYRYTPFGEPDSTYESGITNSVRFAGRELDPETGLYYDRARYYDPQLGRFVSEDPIGVQGGINQYAYADNDPINGRDPSGLCPCIAVPIYVGLNEAATWAVVGILAATLANNDRQINTDAFKASLTWRNFWVIAVTIIRAHLGLPPPRPPQAPERRIPPAPWMTPRGEGNGSPPPGPGPLPPGVNLGESGGGAGAGGTMAVVGEICHYEAYYHMEGGHRVWDYTELVFCETLLAMV